MPDDKESKPSFWTTLPGVLTALGAIMAASAALLTALYTAGLIGSKNKTPDNQPVVSSPIDEPQPNSTKKTGQTTSAEASRDFIIGRWQVEQASGDASIGAVIDYDDDGTFTGLMTNFVGGYGQREQTAGRWDFKKLSKYTFRLTVWVEGQPPLMGTFKIIDQDRVHNIEQNYIAVRSK